MASPSTSEYVKVIPNDEVAIRRELARDTWIVTVSHAPLPYPWRHLLTDERALNAWWPGAPPVQYPEQILGYQLPG